jgi:hypothetical protein
MMQSSGELRREDEGACLAAVIARSSATTASAEAHLREGGSNPESCARLWIASLTLAMTDNSI